MTQTWHTGSAKSGRMYIYADGCEQPVAPNVCVPKSRLQNKTEMRNLQLMATAPLLLQLLRQALLCVEDGSDYQGNTVLLAAAMRAGIAEAEKDIRPARPAR